MEAAPILTAAAVVGVLALVLLYRLRSFLGAAAVSAMGGLTALGLVNATGLATGILLPFNLFSLLVSLVLGAPGVIGLLVMQMFW